MKAAPLRKLFIVVYVAAYRNHSNQTISVVIALAPALRLLVRLEVNRMPYKKPDFIGVAYASRLFREYDYQSSYDAFVLNTRPQPDLTNPTHALELLTWLNKWGCRIEKKEKFQQLIPELGQWYTNQEPQLPTRNIDISELDTNGLDTLESAFKAMRDCGFGSTSAAKALFAIRPKCAIPWDEPIREEFGFGDDGFSYRRMLDRSCQEAKMLIEDAKKYGVKGSVEICDNVGASGSSLAKLLDEYNWITITERHDIPSRGELEKWISWCQ